jgi:hypothetical protein
MKPTDIEDDDEPGFFKRNLVMIILGGLVLAGGGYFAAQLQAVEILSQEEARHGHGDAGHPTTAAATSSPAQAGRASATREGGRDDRSGRSET